MTDINPNNSSAYSNRGLMKIKLDNHYEAISDFNKAIEINKKYPDAYLNRSISKSKIGDIEGACKDAKKAKSLGYKSIENKNWIESNCKSSGFKLF